MRWFFGRLVLRLAPRAAPSRLRENPAPTSFLDTTGLGAEPLPEACGWIEEKLSVAILVRDLSSSKVTALSVRAGPDAAIVLNDADPQREAHPALARVHLAHELCHLFFDRDALGINLSIDEVLDRRKNAAERRARGFAAELLLPDEGLRDLLGPPTCTSSVDGAKDLVREARQRFGTPNEIAVNHLVNLGFISPDLRQFLAGDLAIPICRINTRLPRVGAPSLRVEQLAEQAHKKQLITDGQARELLGLDALRPLPWDREPA